MKKTKVKIKEILESLSSMLTIEECAAVAKVRPNTVRKWINEGYVKAYVVNKKSYRIKPEDLYAVIMSKPVDNEKKEEK